MQINSNEMDLSKYRGQIKPCLLCSSLPVSAKLDHVSSGVVCKMCLGQLFIAICTNCGGTGKYNGKTVWDGGMNDHYSTCTPCGGTGVFPVKKPADWKEPLRPIVAATA